MNRYGLRRLAGALLAVALVGCGPERVDIVELLPEGAAEEIYGAYPEFEAVLVTESSDGLAFGDKYLVVSGVEDEEARGRVTEYVLSYLENPNKAAEQEAERQAYENLPPRDKMNSLVDRVTSMYPDFSYEWVGPGEGNVEVGYGDNSLMIRGVEPAGNREEIAHGIIRIQKLIDAETTGEQ